MYQTSDLTGLLIAHLRADPDLADLVFDGVPDGQPYPYITLGPGETQDDDAECVVGYQEILQFDVWSSDRAKTWPCRDLTQKVAGRLRGFSHEAGTWTLQDTTIEVQRVLPEPQRKGAHGIVQVLCLVEAH